MFILFFQNSSLELEVQFQTELRQARGFDLSNLAKLRTVGAVAVRVIELRMVEDIEQLCSKFEVGTFVHHNVLDGRKIRFADSWSAADRAWRIAHLAKQPWLIATGIRVAGAGRVADVFRENLRIKVIVAVLLWLLSSEGRHLVRFAGVF